MANIQRCECARNCSQKTAVVKFSNEENIIKGKKPTNLPTLRLNFIRFLRVGRATRNKDICDCRLTSLQPYNPLQPADPYLATA